MYEGPRSNGFMLASAGLSGYGCTHCKTRCSSKPDKASLFPQQNRAVQHGVQIYDTLPAQALRFVKRHAPALVPPLLAVHRAWLSSGKRIYQVPARTLHSIMDQYTLSTVDLLKIDVEGGELEVCSIF